MFNSELQESSCGWMLTVRDGEQPGGEAWRMRKRRGSAAGSRTIRPPGTRTSLAASKQVTVCLFHRPRSSSLKTLVEWSTWSSLGLSDYCSSSKSKILLFFAVLLNPPLVPLPLLCPLFEVPLFFQLKRLWFLNFPPSPTCVMSLPVYSTSCILRCLASLPWFFES